MGFWIGLTHRPVGVMGLKPYLRPNQTQFLNGLKPYPVSNPKIQTLAPAIPHALDMHPSFFVFFTKIRCRLM